MAVKAYLRVFVIIRISSSCISCANKKPNKRMYRLEYSPFSELFLSKLNDVTSRRMSVTEIYCNALSLIFHEVCLLAPVLKMVRFCLSWLLWLMSVKNTKN